MSKHVFNRHETKYILTSELYNGILAKLQKHLSVDEYGETTIQSLYYDTPTNLLIRNSIEKPFYKEKIRVRSYGRATNDSKVFLKLKKKVDKTVFKRRISLKYSEVESFFKSYIAPENNKKSQILNEIIYFCKFYQTLRPSMLLLYDRTAYVDSESDLRVTFDKNVRYRTENLDLRQETSGEPQLNIYTDKYSEYSEDVTVTSQSTYYLRYSSTAYKYSIKYYNSDSDYLWVNVSDSYETVSSSSGRPGGSSKYYYYTFAKHTEYAKLKVYMYSSSQTQGQEDSYYACSSYVTVNTSYDTIALSCRSGSLSVNWTTYSTSSSQGGGMDSGNSDKGEYSTKGIKSANEIVIKAGIINITSYDDSIHANNDGGTLENGNTPLGNITISGGTLTIYSNDDGIHADGVTVISGGTVAITNSYEGIEGSQVSISGGDVSVISSDDGLNGTGTSGTSITLSGGTLYVKASGDGVDSNSTTSSAGIIFSGTDAVIISNSNGNAAIDSEKGYTYSGGRVLAVASTGGMSSENTNCSNFSSIATSKSASLSSGQYITVSVSSTIVVTLKMPVAMSATVIYLGSSSATISTSSSSSANLDASGVCWN